MTKCLLFVLAVCGFSAAAAAINVNEKTVREELNLLLGKADAQLPTTFYYSGEDKKGKDCSMEVHTKWEDEPTEKINSQSIIQFSMEGFWSGFDGEGPPERFGGKPLQSYESSSEKLVLKQDDQEKDKWENHSSVVLLFSKGHNLENLISVDGKSSHGDEVRTGYCGKLELTLALDSKSSETMEELINAQVKKNDKDQKIEIFNGCEPTSKPNKEGLVKVSCGFAVDEENDHQGTAKFTVGGDSITLEKVTLEGEVIFLRRETK